jgi:LysM repeat protein
MGINQKYIIGILLLLNSLFSLAQDHIYEVRDGKKYIVHVVESGQTLYSIKSTYNTSIEVLLQHNPTAEQSLQIGQRIYIPFEEDSNQKSITHVVQKKETLFGISRQYNCSIESIIALNPEAEKGLQIGQTLKIPNKEENISDSSTSIDQDFSEERTNHSPVLVQPEDSLINYTVLKKETLYSISKRFMVPIEELRAANGLRNNKISEGDTLIIPLKKERTTVVEYKHIPSSNLDTNITFQRDSAWSNKEEYTISFLLPIKISSNPKIITGLFDENTQLNKVSEVALEFWMGAKLALDSLEKLGLKANVHVFDTEGSKSVMENLLQSEKLLQSDYIFGPFFPSSIELAANWAKENNKHLFLPVAASPGLVENNPFVHLLVPSDLTLLGGLAKYMASEHAEDKIVLVQSAKDKEREEYFLHAFQLASDSSKEIIQTTLGSSSGRDLARMVDLKGKTLFICLAEDPQGTMGFINTLNAAKNSTSQHGKADIIAVGDRKWHDLNALSSYYKNRFQLITPMPNYINFDETNTDAFVVEFQQTYGSDASKFALQGFDVVFHNLSSNTSLADSNQRGIINNFNLISLGSNEGRENASTFIVQQSEYELHLKGIVEGNIVLFPNQTSFTRNEATDQH